MPSSSNIQETSGRHASNLNRFAGNRHRRRAPRHAGRSHRRRSRCHGRQRVLHRGSSWRSRDAEGIRLQGHRRSRLLRTARRQHLLQRPHARRHPSAGGLGALAGQGHQRRSLRRNSRSCRSSASWRATSISTTTTSIRSPPPTALTTRAAPRRPRSMPTRASSTPKAAPSTPPSATRCWPTPTDSSAITGALTARFRRCPSRRWKARRCSATTGTPWR